MASGEASESLQCMICILKVSIHCEGCKKKVNRILRSIPGVYDCEIDARLHKVTVKASVDPEVLIRKLERSRKHVALWPESKPGNGDAGIEKESKAPVKAKESPENSEKKPTPPAPESNPPATAAAAPAQALDANKTETEAKSAAPAEPPIPDGKTVQGKTQVSQASDAKPAENADTSAPLPEKPAAATAAKADSNEKKADSCKKKGSKPPKEASGDASTNSGPTSNSMSSPLPPPQYMYPYPAYAPPPAYVMSYNMAQPSISQAYYASPVPSASQGHSYTPAPPPPEYYYEPMGPSSWAPMQPSPRHDMFSDENPNACNIM